MEPSKVVQVLKNERDCVARNISNECDKQCGKCDLVLPDKDIIEAYTFAIEKLSWYYRLNEKWYAPSYIRKAKLDK